MSLVVIGVNLPSVEHCFSFTNRDNSGKVDKEDCRMEDNMTTSLKDVDFSQYSPREKALLAHDLQEAVKLHGSRLP